MKDEERASGPVALLTIVGCALIAWVPVVLAVVVIWKLLR